MSDTIADLREHLCSLVKQHLPWSDAGEILDGIAALADERDRLQAYIDRWDAGIEMEHIQNTGETFPMTVDRLRRERDEARSVAESVVTGEGGSLTANCPWKRGDR